MALAAPRSSPGGATHEARLAHAAAAGSGRAFARLYDTYERRAFNLALRITGSVDLAAEATRDAFLDALQALPHLKSGEPFGSCLLRAARNAACERAAADPAAAASAGEDPPPPEGDPGLEEWQAEIQAAAMRLGPRERELLALETLEELSYAGIAAIVDSDGEAIPEGIARSRLRLHAELFGSELAPMSDDCEAALPLIVMRDDGQLDDEEDLGWLLEHLAHCASCRRRLDAMEEASAAYRRWETAAPPPALARETMDAAARVASADWSELAGGWASTRSPGPARGTHGGAQAAARPRHAAAAIGPAVSSASEAVTGAIGSARARASGLASGAWGRRPARGRLVTVGLLGLMLIGLSAIAAGATLVLKERDRTPARGADTAADVAAEEQDDRQAASADQPEPRPRVRTRSRPKKVKAAPQETMIVKPTPLREPAESAEERRRREAESRRRAAAEVKAVPLPKSTPQPPGTRTPEEAPPAETVPQTPQIRPTGCTDAAGRPVPCP